MMKQSLPSTTARAVTALAATFGLPAPAEQQLLTLVELLAGDPLAPTTVKAPPRIVQDHLADSLVALRLDAVRRAVRIADIGSGAGLPALPLAVAKPEAGFTLLESNGRKTEFLSRAITACGLANAKAVPTRVEEWSAGAGEYDLVTARAVADLDVLAEYAAPLLRIGGALVAWRGQTDPQVEARAEAAASLLGLSVHPPIQVFPYPEARQRHLHVLVKVSPTPARFPRRPGVAAKRPLGRSG